VQFVGKGVEIHWLGLPLCKASVESAGQSTFWHLLSPINKIGRAAGNASAGRPCQGQD